jgi:hypothetical protein
VTNRYRCNSCGNLTRFDITISRRTRAFHHYSVGGELHVEDEEVLSESIDEVVCRWCGTGAGVVVLSEDDVELAADAQVAQPEASPDRSQP